jgi:photosystem II stability/assembly factor-like uncharacterized protein
LVFSVFMVKAQPWTQIASPTPSNLLGIHFVDDQIGYVVGYNGGIYKTINGGSSWSAPLPSNTTEHLYSTYFIDANTGFVVGDNGIVRRTSDGGASWQTPTIPTSGSTSVAGHSFRGIWFYNAYEGYIVGGVSTSLGTILKTTNGGLDWTNISPTQVPGSGGKAFYGVFFTDALNGYACDFDGRILKTTNGGNGGGNAWIPQPTPTTNHLADIAFVPPSNSTTSTIGFAVGGNASSSTNAGVILKLISGTWTDITNSVLGTNTNTNFFSDITFFGNTGFIAGGNVSANTSVIYKTVDGGNTWTLEPTIPLSANSVKRLARISLPCSHTGFACGLSSSGFNGTILKVEGINEKTCCDDFNNTFLNANFTYTNSGSVYTFTNPTGTTSTDILTWTFGDGQTGSGSNPSHTYPSVSSSYLATLYIQRPQANGDTCKVKLSKLIDTKPCSNLITNGDFSLGNDGSFTTGLPNGQRCIPASCDEGAYCIGNTFSSKCSSWPATFDHTFETAAGSFMSIDGNTSTAGAVDIWRTSTPLNVSTNTTYKFSFWAKSIYSPTQQVLNISRVITGNGAGSVPLIIALPNTLSTTTWKEYTIYWNSGTSTTATLAIQQLLPTAFSDFGIDDISFCCVDCEDFMTDVMNFGIQSTLVSGNTYKYCVSPNVSTSDIVQWDMDCNGSVDFTGNTPCQNFTLTGANSQICATVLHVIKPGDTCRVKVKTCLPNVPTKPCSCDTAIFNSSVNAGFTQTKTPPFTMTFTPVSLLNNCDTVTWLFGNGQQATSVGSASVTYTYPAAGTYTVCMLVRRTASDGAVCKRESCVSVKIDGISPIAEIAMPTLNIKPNPTTQSVLVTLPEGIQDIEGILKLSSVEGRILKSMPVRSTEIDMNLGMLPAGVYFISFYDNKDNRLTRPTKLVKQ